MIGVKVEQLHALERDGLPTVQKGKGRRYPIPAAIRWFVDYSIERRVGGVPPRVNQQDLAGLVGVVPRQVKNLVDAGKLSSVVEGARRLFPLPLAVHEFIKYREELAREGRQRAVDPLKEAQIRRLTAQAEQEELELLRKRGESIDRITAVRAHADLLSALRSQALQAPNRHARKFVQLPSVPRARQALRALFNDELVRWGAAAAQVGRRIQLIGEDDSPEDLEPADAADDLAAVGAAEDAGDA